VQPPWSAYRSDPVTQSVERSSVHKRTGEYSLATSGFTDYSAPTQMIAITPGNYLARVHYYVPEQSETQGIVLNYHIIYDQQMKWIGTAADGAGGGSRTVSKGKWVLYEYAFTVPESYGSDIPVEMRFGMAHLGFQPGETIYFDDFELYRLQD